jgi:hypothetical protein
MSIPAATWHHLKSQISGAHLGPIISISGAIISLGCIVAGFYLLASVTAGANLIATRFVIRRLKKENLGTNTNR